MSMFTQLHEWTIFRDLIGERHVERGRDMKRLRGLNWRDLRVKVGELSSSDN